MSNTVNVTSDILAQGALEGFLSITQPLNIFSTNFSPDPAQKGATVSVPLYGTIANADNFNGDYTTNSDQTINEVAVNLTTHFYKTVNVSDTDAAKGIDGFKLAFQAGQAVAKSVFTGAMGALNLTRAPGGTPTMTVGEASSFGQSGVLALRTAAAGWGSDKNMLFDSSYYTQFLATLPSATTLQDKATSNGTVPGAYGFAMYETDIQPFCQGYTGAKVMAAHPSALAIASRYLAPDDGGTYIESRAITDDKTKTTLGMRTWYDPSKGKKFMTIEWLGGYTAGVSGAVAFINEV
jgi:hypothetical protein